ncbi:(d)CMP kinase [uncultured Acetobacteroides sp.]|uniref:(d)CMP kinase n=1 Tax=uncultured Acetobacteroides sp. TaxID=1760811 RepID=UPI0029F5BEF2|nr:(d)CMP kinase [uncultured Acetobacteroides sp.]
MSNRKVVIAVDGYSSCGKSTFAKAIAKRLGYAYIDSGAMYRATTLYGLQNGMFDANGVLNAQKLIAALPLINITFRFNGEKQRNETFLNGVCVEDEIRTIAVADKVSHVAEIGEVREQMVLLQQQMGKEKGIVMDGRDIGTVVFPDAEFKIFMTADPAIRAQRRYDELKAKGEEVDINEVEENIRKRDYIDENREVSPLRRANDAHILDNSHMTVEEQMVWVEEHLNRIVSN